MNLRHLELFVAVANEGSFTRAAERLHVSQPAVSARIRDLEISLGQDLFQQEGRQIYLTDAGQELLDRAEAILAQVTEAQRALTEIEGLQRGSLRLAATTTVGSYVLPRFLGRFHRTYPGISLTLDVTNWRQAVDLLRRHQTDLAVLGPTEELGDMVVDAFMKNELVVAAAPEHPLTGHRSIPFAELATYPMLVREKGSGTRQDTERLFANHGLRPIVAMELRHSAAIKQGVAAGLGVALLSRESMQLHLATRTLVILDVEGLPFQRDWHIVHHRVHRLPRAALAFKEMMLASPEEHPFLSP